jgi:hypothetical protein
MDEEKSKHVILTILHPKYYVQAIFTAAGGDAIS